MLTAEALNQMLDQITDQHVTPNRLTISRDGKRVLARGNRLAQVWDIATPLGVAQDPDREGLTDQERALLKLLAGGLTDEAAATRLGVSTRTARRMMADLMERLNARSRFEAGLKAAQRGWL